MGAQGVDIAGFLRQPHAARAKKLRRPGVNKESANIINRSFQS
jgi:hypothetical protein